MDEIGGQSPQYRYLNFKLIYMVLQMIGITILILMASWIGIHLGGLGDTSNPQILFNWHPLLMTFSMIYLYGNSILIYRALRYSRKKLLKVTHSSIFGSIMISIIFALVTVFQSHNLAKPKPIPNLYSLHSWLGLLTVILFFAQWVAGFVSFMYPKLKGPTRESFMPIHVYFGLTGFICAIATALMGISEKAFFHVPNIADLPNEQLLANTIGILIVVFGCMVMYLVTNKTYKRQPLPEDEILLTGTDD